MRWILVGVVVLVACSNRSDAPSPPGAGTTAAPGTPSTSPNPAAPVRIDTEAMKKYEAEQKAADAERQKQEAARRDAEAKAAPPGEAKPEAPPPAPLPGPTLTAESCKALLPEPHRSHVTAAIDGNNLACTIAGVGMIGILCPLGRPAADVQAELDSTVSQHVVGFEATRIPNIGRAAIKSSLDKVRAVSILAMHDCQVVGSSTVGADVASIAIAVVHKIDDAR